METEDRYKEKTQHENQYPDSTKNNNPTQVCANCSKLLETGAENDAIFDIEVSEQFNLAFPPASAAATKHVYETEFRESNSTQKIQVRNIIESVYKLHYLDLLSHPETKSERDSSDPLGVQLENVDDDVPISSYENICLCSPCSHVLTSMYKYYLLFNQLRQLNSFLAKKINRLDEMVEAQSQKYQRRTRPIRTQSQAVDEALGPVIKCEALIADEDENIFADDAHFDDVNDVSQDQYAENEEFGFVPDPVPASPKNVMISENLYNSGPWVRLTRLKNVPVGCPVLVSNVNTNLKTKKYHEFDNPSVVGTRTERKTRKSINQVKSIYLVSSGPSDSDDSNDSDFHIEFESMPSKRKRNFPLRSSRKVTDTPRYRNQDKSPNSKSSHTAVYNKDVGPADSSDGNGKDESVRIRSSDSDSDPEEEHTPKRQKPKSKSSTRKKGNKAKPKVGELSSLARSRDEIREAKRARYRIDKGYRRRKVRAPNPCWHCPLDFPTQQECYAHAKATHYKPDTGHIICTRCSKVCPNKYSFSTHQKICESLCPGEKRAAYTCHQCGAGFAFKSHRDTHLIVHIEERNFPCPNPGCSFKGKSTLLLNNHFNRMHVETEPTFKTGEDGQLILVEPVVFKCDDCETTFKTALSRQLHAAKFHTEDGFKKYREQQRAILDRLKEESKIRIAKRSHICPECHVDFLSHLRLVCHQKTVHNMGKECVCDQCGKYFSSEASLRQHVNYCHSENRPFICEHCGNSFKTSQNLKDHVSHTHSEEGRRKYNEFMRRQNQKRKIVAEALAKRSSSSIIDNDVSADGNLPTRAAEAETGTAVSENTGSVRSFFS